MKRVKQTAAWLMLCCMLLTGCRQGEPNEIPAPALMDPKRTGAKENTIPVARMDLYDGSYIDVIVVPQTEELHFQMEGEIVSIDALAGETVEEGQVLAKLNQTSLLDAIEAQQEEIAYFQARYELQSKQAQLAIQIADMRLTQLQKAYADQEQRKAAEEEARKKAEKEAQKAAEEGPAAPGEPDRTESTPPPEQQEENESTPTPQQPQPSEPPETPPPEQPQPVVTQHDLQLANLSLQEKQLRYTQLQEEYNQEMQQREEELQALLDQVGEDTLTAPFSGRVVEIYGAVGSHVTENDVVMLLVNEEKKMLRGEAFYDTALRSVRHLEAEINGEITEVTYIPYDDREYLRQKEEGDPSTWFTFEDAGDIAFGEEGVVRAYNQYSEDALVIPASCVRSDELGKYVYKAEEGKRVKTYVVLGIVTKNYAQIRDGLTEGDEVYGVE